MPREVKIAFVDEKLLTAFQKLSKGKFENRQLATELQQAFSSLKQNFNWNGTRTHHNYA